jgi:hypothetical protein
MTLPWEALRCLDVASVATLPLDALRCLAGLEEAALLPEVRLLFAFGAMAKDLRAVTMEGWPLQGAPLLSHD